ncbi:hypothetical protein DL96DRAFT_1623726 [Flagelloscypha sp. PMI_526]|nr:hypothetical protein DL96DRAFT_1623726 [Flagelloscypha sp. PMI_526]
MYVLVLLGRSRCEFPWRAGLPHSFGLDSYFFTAHSFFAMSPWKVSEEYLTSNAGVDVGITQRVIGFDVLLIVGFFPCTAVLLTAAFSKRVVRSPQWFVFMAFGSWWSIQHLLLLGNQLTSRAPPHALCLIQSALIYAAPPATALSLLALFLQILLRLVECLENKSGVESLFSPALVATPIVVYAGVIILALSIGIINPEQVARDPQRVTCYHTGRTTMFVAAGIVTVICGGIMIIEGFILTKLWRNYNHIRTLNVASNAKKISFSIAIRAMIFSILPLLALIVSIVSMVMSSKDQSPTNPVANTILASLPLAASVAFGTQRDIVDTWAFWKRPSSTLLSDSQKSPNGEV